MNCLVQKKKKKIMRCSSVKQEKASVSEVSLQSQQCFFAYNALGLL